MVWDKEECKWVEFFFIDTIKLFAETFILEKALPIIEKKYDKHLEKLEQIHETMDSLVGMNESNKFNKLSTKFDKEFVKVEKYINLQKKYYKNYNLIKAWEEEAERRI